MNIPIIGGVITAILVSLFLTSRGQKKDKRTEEDQ